MYVISSVIHMKTLNIKQSRTYAHVSIYSTRNIASSKIVQTQMIFQTMTNANYVYEIVEAIKIK